MSKTYKHQAKYDRKVYWNTYSPWGSMKPIIEDGQVIGWEKTPPVSVPDEPHPWYGMNVDLRRKTFWYKWSNRKCRRKAKSLIQQGNWEEAIVLKPENVDWTIW